MTPEFTTEQLLAIMDAAETAFYSGVLLGVIVACVAVLAIWLYRKD